VEAAKRELGLPPTATAPPRAQRLRGVSDDAAMSPRGEAGSSEGVGGDEEGTEGGGTPRAGRIVSCPGLAAWGGVRAPATSRMAPRAEGGAAAAVAALQAAGSAAWLGGGGGGSRPGSTDAPRTPVSASGEAMAAMRSGSAVRRFSWRHAGTVRGASLTGEASHGL
jgi:hypothetical protein